MSYDKNEKNLRDEARLRRIKVILHEINMSKYVVIYSLLKIIWKKILVRY